jgi:F-type H+-transporting ATPase subunit delta
VDVSAGIQASLAGRYASALFELASEGGPKGGNVTAVEADLDTLAEALRASPDLSALARNPEVSREALGRALAAIGEHLGLSELTRNFLGVLAQNRRAAELPAIIRAFHAIAAAQRGEVNAEVVSAHPLTETQFSTLEQKLRAREGRTVKLKSRVDPDLLGGLVVTVGSKRIDGSIRSRLNSLAQAMKG